MANRWDFGKKSVEQKQAEEQEDVEGTFGCQRCDEYVDKAIYLPLRKILTWKCINGHKSYIEDIDL